MNKYNIHVGDRVCYTDNLTDKKENGIVKSISAKYNTAYVVYKCDNDWDHYEKYTAEATNMAYLTKGWIDHETNEPT